jgi:hypothetical protein
VTWIDFGDALQLEAGHVGGRWELSREPAEADFIAEVVEGVLAGEAVEVFGWHRSRVEVSLRDGATAMETGYDGLRGSLPMPGWTRSGRGVAYPPYRFADHRWFLLDPGPLTPVELAEAWQVVFAAVRREATTLLLAIEWSEAEDWPLEVMDAARGLQEMAADPDFNYTMSGPLAAADDAAWQAFTQVAPWCFDASIRAHEAELVSLVPLDEPRVGAVRLTSRQKAAIEQRIGAQRLIPQERWLARKRRWAWLDFVQARNEDQAERSGARRMLPHASHRQGKSRH